MKRPAIGCKLYIVVEHLYYLREHTAPVKEYCVCEVKVSEYIERGYIEIKVIGKSPEGYETPYFYKLTDIEKRIFYSPRDAAILARSMTKKYEKIWGAIIRSPGIPMRRPWEKLLNSQSGYEIEGQISLFDFL